jgi:molybdate-binding protein
MRRTRRNSFRIARTSTAPWRCTNKRNAFDVASHDLPPEQTIGVSYNYEVIGNTNSETSYFVKMYLRDARWIKSPATLIGMTRLSY